MDRCKDYCDFAIRFAGIGYVVLWPFSANGGRGHPFGASIVCEDAHRGVLTALCDLPHPFALPVGLHILGFAAAMMVAARLVLRLLDRFRQRPGIVSAAVLNARLPGAVPARRQPQALRLRKIRPRKHFGLRGMQR